jgi:hypothetical protein
VQTFEIESWSTAPAFAAVGVTLGPNEPEFRPFESTTWYVLIEGSVRHRGTNVIYDAPKALRFDAGELPDLEVLADIRYWDYTLAAQPGY